MRDTAGFTLVELMIVVAIIVVIAAIAIPMLLRSRINANETNAIGGLRTMSSAEMNFKSSVRRDDNNNGVGEYGSMADLAAPDPPFVDESLCSGKKAGYYFTVVLDADPSVNERQWFAVAYPVAKALTGNRTFYIDESGVLRGKNLGGPVGAEGQQPEDRETAVEEFTPIGG